MKNLINISDDFKLQTKQCPHCFSFKPHNSVSDYYDFPKFLIRTSKLQKLNKVPEIL